MKVFGFKEWQLVCEAMERGEQSVILRKGGISEGKRGFEWLHTSFFLFPTYFHEQSSRLKSGTRWEDTRFEPDAERQTVEIRLHARVLSTWQLDDLDDALELSDLHVWKDEVIEERFRWGDQPGLSLAVVDFSRLAKPWTLTNRPGFGGCRSWLGLPSDEGLAGDWEDLLLSVTGRESIQRIESRLRETGARDASVSAAT